jgi:dihydroorotate dehydrogenase (NAD+) catalytic subunit
LVLKNTPNLSTTIGKIRLKNPVMPASGVFAFWEDIAKLIDLSRLGALVTKSLRAKPSPGNPPPRVAEIPAGILASVGIQSIGFDAFIESELPFLCRFNTPIIVSLAGESVEEFVEMAKKLNSVNGVAGIELNLSCPNVKKFGMHFGRDPEMTKEIVSKVRAVTNLTLIAKLTPNVTSIAEIAKAAEEGGADALTLINSPLGMAIDVETWRPKLANITGGMSGPAIRPIGVRAVWESSKAVNIPIIGVGGIASTSDALEYIIAGARAVQVGAANFHNPYVMIEIIEGLQDYLIRKGIDDINKLVGCLITQ